VDIPVERPAKFTLHINLKTAKVQYLTCADEDANVVCCTAWVSSLALEGRFATAVRRFKVSNFAQSLYSTENILVGEPHHV
jgi:hypothetical protein